MEEQNPYLVDCPHRRWRWARRINSNNTEHFGKQCLFCGIWKAQKKEVVAQYAPLNEVGPFEKSIQDHYHEKVRESQRNQTEATIRANRVVLAEYYQTDHWKAYRKFRHELNRALFDGICEMCRESPAEHIHHLTYQRLYRELPFDTAAVCEQCHTTEHPHMTVES